ncbi:isochorismate synthase / 2-succinyl-5-enolpyruvyl-6-hydroxy-3-cyclohexene-1-carboxylate synthase / 2-succinyl-6-hydroxy-2,4-cyclohexadiene-1-carboxylate synthase / O-succinylbenzoate synthase [Fistulifera solaris]|uniref:isochorismate synthase n=1 Tax=Fistulifera solaris TaxID=1519565 RepID=A0A1Z5JQW7_FISSO|nr:isochorismate synthase / 2-succinyl-5-enolpyruvyl-6-hydroxy-3-cyclohexene-1-carboxylate synthase / 2-succinyl-6-hydroxy-2,4-cyclohexadiene-1-carboxylate synthase / O-succinylbenzoate synthase [Fistulifera solaris]|eukprot:GAX16420.1 isochorismate synthase / 2-succinyl-5-enolpyruvyl-6-hydroxy-3-cyclohexene-1-carboxylate synthase / 2-succinyl-6-hydroxy-2,4-cyclohexadiene-1-carboxylate synthase / O-succinylbenzoate synthase [Fistulifera solaris]
MQRALDVLSSSSNSENDTLYRLEMTFSRRLQLLPWLKHQLKYDPEQHFFYLQTATDDAEEIVAWGIQQAVDHTSALWDDHRQLPLHARWYGAQTFDGNMAQWVLPMLEWRQNVTHTVLALHTTGTREEAARIAQSINTRHLDDEWTIPTPLPPVVSKTDLAIDAYEQGVEEAIALMQQEKQNGEYSDLQKVVLARQQLLQFKHPFHVVDLLQRWKQESGTGNLFAMALWDEKDDNTIITSTRSSSCFVGCTPEQLFRIHNSTVTTEALAGTRPRGSHPQEDADLLQELVNSPKDLDENACTARYIEEVLSKQEPSIGPFVTSQTFVRRTRHLQHICRTYQAPVWNNTSTLIRNLLEQLHPTPAVCGLPLNMASDYIRRVEPFSRDYYAGPIGYLSSTESQLLVGIRSAVLRPKQELLLTAGSGLVLNSTLREEFAETVAKFQVVASWFSSPLSLQSCPNINTAWATAVVEEFVRCGVDMVFVCPGSRSTPLAVAWAWARRQHPFLRVISCHDERAAAFRAVGYGKASGRPAVVVTSSGTAVANLLPAVLEAHQDDAPMILLTADRPSEHRDISANQAMDQVKLFGDKVAWFRDILPPSDEVNVVAALSDANFAHNMALEQQQPVHINVQFRENLAPEGGPVRGGDGDAVESYNATRFTQGPAFARWSGSGQPLIQRHSSSTQNNDVAAANLVQWLRNSRRGLLVVGQIPPSQQDEVYPLLDQLAQTIGFPILATSSSLRFTSHAVVWFAEHLLSCPNVREAVQPDFILQVGAPLLSTTITSYLKQTAQHVILQTNARRRIDPEYSVTHSISTPNMAYFLESLILRTSELPKGSISSALTPLVPWSRTLAPVMKELLLQQSPDRLTEPQIILALAQKSLPQALFLSNSMPIRDAESFLYPYGEIKRTVPLTVTGSNRGVSGIDGIIATAQGFALNAAEPTQLIIGDVSALHDLNSFAFSSARKLSTLIVNNNGGAIFSFLPVAQHDVSFEEFFSTPTQHVDWEATARGLSVQYKKVATYEALMNQWEQQSVNTLVEAVVISREENVQLHRDLTKKIQSHVSEHFWLDSTTRPKVLPLKRYTSNNANRTLLLLHGWMGCKEDWDDVVEELLVHVGDDWNIVSIDLPGHNHLVPSIESISSTTSGLNYSVSAMAEWIGDCLAQHYQLREVNAVAGYSLGGRIGLELSRLYSIPQVTTISSSLEPIPVDDSGRAQRDDKLSQQLQNIFQQQLVAANPTTMWGEFLESWYSAPIWGHLKERRPDTYRAILERRTAILQRAGASIAQVLSEASPGRPENRRCEQDYFDRRHSLLIGELDSKYSLQSNATLISESGHALLWESPKTIALHLAEFLSCNGTSKNGDASRNNATVFVGNNRSSTAETLDVTIATTSSGNEKSKESSILKDGQREGLLIVESLDYQVFSIQLLKDRNQGLGWGASAAASSTMQNRTGMIIELRAFNYVGLGEVSPLKGVHDESLEQAQVQIQILQERLKLDSPSISLIENIDALLDAWEQLLNETWYTSVRFGLEMALRSLLWHANGMLPSSRGLLPLNGLQSRNSLIPQTQKWPSLKVKVGHDSIERDQAAIYQGFRSTLGKIRADANRAWDEEGALEFAFALEGWELQALNRLEYIEEPLQKVNEAAWSLEQQIEALERFYLQASIPYALDESIGDLVQAHRRNWERIRENLRKSFSGGRSSRGCACFVLKPAVLGFALTTRIAKLAREELQIPVVISSCMESGLGLAHAAFLAGEVDALPCNTPTLAHGLSTYSILSADLLSPSFASYVNAKGFLNVQSLGRALYGLNLDEVRTMLPDFCESSMQPHQEEDKYCAGTSFNRNEEISIVASLHLPFSAETAHARFTDLPQQPRWSPWITSVEYQGEISEWRMNVRGMSISWRARSEVRRAPHLGIQWESVDGLRNRGSVEFVPDSANSGNCQMQVRITLVPPALLKPLFHGAWIFLEDYLRDKLVQWSLEMFRDVVKADLALERGDLELGDALFNAVEGKATAIEATLNIEKSFE